MHTVQSVMPGLGLKTHQVRPIRNDNVQVRRVDRRKR
jgi:hypothetical protein